MRLFEDTHIECKLRRFFVIFNRASKIIICHWRDSRFLFLIYHINPKYFFYETRYKNFFLILCIKISKLRIFVWKHLHSFLSFNFMLPICNFTTLFCASRINLYDFSDFVRLNALMILVKRILRDLRSPAVRLKMHKVTSWTSRWRVHGFDAVPESARESRNVSRIAHHTRFAYHAHARESMRCNGEYNAKGTLEI